MTSIYDLSWKKTSFRNKLQLFFASRKECGHKIKYENIYGKADGYSALSSTYYSILGTAYAQLDMGTPTQRMLSLITWLPLAIWCYWRMLPLSNKVVKLIGYENMSAEQCDIRQSILRRRNRFVEAKECIFSALAKKSKKIHTYGLLRVGLADIYVKEDNPRGALKILNFAINNAEKAEETDPLQAGRIYKHCSKLLDLLGYTARAAGLRQKAQNIALKHGAKDQILKVKVST